MTETDIQKSATMMYLSELRVPTARKMAEG